MVAASGALAASAPFRALAPSACTSGRSCCGSVPRRANAGFPRRRSVSCSVFGNEKEAAAKKALMDALAGKKDILAEVEQNQLRQAGGGGPGGRRGGGGGGGGGGGFGENWDKFRREAGETIKAIAIIVGVLTLFSTWRQLLALFVNLVFWVLRVPTGERTVSEPVSAAEHVVSNWANDEDE